ncbi:hypothetical protein J4401_06475 [Candidatus Woesearchaeota archaeon]|nr:hypothetical protein [Candidatus Woesearchaeota archaeon]
MVDLGIWAFWNIQWWTALLLLAGIIGLAMGQCKDCQACCQTATKKK